MIHPDQPWEDSVGHEQHVFHDEQEGVYRMLYGVVNEVAYQYHYVPVLAKNLNKAEHFSPYFFCYAESRDGIHWKPALGGKPVLGPAPPDNFGSANGKKGNNHSVHPSKLIVIKDRLRIWYGAEGHKPSPGKQYAPSAIGLMEASPEKRQ